MDTEHTKYTVEALVKQFGPFVPIARQREGLLYAEGKGAYVFTIVSTDVEWKDLPEDDRPTLEELEEHMDCTPEDYTEPRYYGQSGSCMVNMHEIYEATNPMPEGIVVESDEDWADGGTLPTEP